MLTSMSRLFFKNMHRCLQVVKFNNTTRVQCVFTRGKCVTTQAYLHVIHILHLFLAPVQERFTLYGAGYPWDHVLTG